MHTYTEQCDRRPHHTILPLIVVRTLVVIGYFFVCMMIPKPGRAEMGVNIDRQTVEQGQFFSVTASKEEVKEPTLFFLDRSFRMFKQPDATWKALLPVENLTPPGMYPLLLRRGDHEHKSTITVLPNNRPIQHIALDSSKTGLMATELEKARVKAALQTQSAEKLFHGIFIRPVTGRTSSLFGLKRSYNNSPVESYHKGIDIAAPQGRPVRSTAKGTVILTGTVEEGFQLHGNTIIIDHGQALLSVYLHLSAIAVQQGQMVKSGEIIGYVGHTGISTAPHLHWGIYLYGISVDPELFEGRTL